MSVQYSAIKWNRNKRIYDCFLAAGIVLYVVLFFLAGKLVWQGTKGISDEVLLIRAFGTCAFLLLHVVLCIGPLARFDRRFLHKCFPSLATRLRSRAGWNATATCSSSPWPATACDDVERGTHFKQKESMHGAEPKSCVALLHQLDFSDVHKTRRENVHKVTGRHAA